MPTSGALCAGLEIWCSQMAWTARSLQTAAMGPG